MDSQVTRIQKLTRGGNFRAWLVHLRAYLTTLDGLDVWLDQLPESEEDVAADKLSRDKLILCLENDTLLLVEEHVTTHQALEALRSDHLGHMRSQRSQIMGEVTRMRQSQSQSVKDYVAVGRESIVKLREVGIEDPSTLVIPCFKNGIDSRLRQHVLPLLNQEQFDTNFELLAQEFQRISVGMVGAAGTEGQSHSAHGERGRQPWKK
jgi:hypothetical protein